MEKISLNIKRSANQRELISLIQKEINSEAALEIHEEKIGKEPILSQAPVGVHEAVVQLVQLFQAGSIVRIVIEGEIYDFIKKLPRKAKDLLVKFVGANNKQRGNAWGAKVEIKRKIAKGHQQTLHFFLDKISEATLEDALTKIYPRVEKLNDLLSEDYIKELKNIGFEFNMSDAEWHIMGVEMFDGKTEVPKEKE